MYTREIPPGVIDIVSSHAFPSVGPFLLAIRVTKHERDRYRTTGH
jgi:hypothetical protein